MRASTCISMAIGLIASVASAQPPVPNACVAIQVSAPASTHPTVGGGFSARLVEDLTISVLFPGDLKDAHILALDLTTPKGFLYQTITVPVAAPGAPPTARAIEGYPRPVQELAPRATTVGTARFQQVDVPFPVGGTMIATGSLYGTWRVAPRLDGALKPCAPATAFTIVP